MTDNRVLVSENGHEAVWCNRADGLGFEMLKSAGISVLIMSTEKNPVVSHRARKLNVEVQQAVSDKGQEVRKILHRRNLHPSQVAYVGNDVNDLSAFNEVGYRLCPSDAADEIRDVCEIVLKSGGGGGVVREIARVLNITWKNTAM